MNTREIPFDFDAKRAEIGQQWQTAIKTLQDRVNTLEGQVSKLNPIIEKLMTMDASKGLAPFELANLQVFIHQTLEAK